MDHVQGAGKPLINPAPGSLVRRLRKAKGLDQRDLAAPLRTNVWQIRRYECGREAIPDAHLSVIADTLGEDVEKFSAPVLVECSNRETELLAAFRRIPTSEGRESAFQVVNAIGAIQEHASC